MEIYGYCFNRESDIKHHGILGMKWGVRRWQNSDGTFNEAGKNRYFDKGTGENYHPVTKGAPAVPSKFSESSKKNGGSFDKEKAKKIAKGVAIGAAVVGGTILVAYGAKYMKDNDVLGRIREGRLENARLNEQFKTDKLQIKLNSKLERERIKEGFKFDLKGIQADPTGRVNKDVLRKELIKSQGNATGLRKVLSEFNDSDIERLNSGKATLADLRLEHHPWSANQEKHADYYEKYKDYYGDKNEVAKTLAGKIGDGANKVYKAATSEQAKEAYKKVAQVTGQAARTTGETAKKVYNAVTSEQAKETYKKVAQTTGQVAKKAYKAATSEQAKTAVKNAAAATKEGVKTAASIAKSSAEVAKLAAQHPQETKAAMDYTAQLLRNLGELSAANSRNSAVVSRSSASDTYTRNQVVKEYKKQHPGTKLTDSQIASNYGF